ncbi:MAG TPA: GNAT family N-acetyltransferase [Anaerohalosphaeraceae bacterium]|nr:GNAT family N-acetyltransferase [Anaerohalosphaeraceae bacterium]
MDIDKEHVLNKSDRIYVIVYKNKSNTVKIRLANFKDIDQLLLICQQSFLWTLRWQAKRLLARNWWELVLVGESAETWVVEDKGHIAAFCLLVTNEVMWNKGKRLRRGSFAAILLSALFHPIFTGCFIIRVLNGITKRIILHVHKVEVHSYLRPKVRTWIELIAVNPECRGLGLAGILLNHCNTRTKELGRKAIALRVSSENTPAIKLYEKHGFLCYYSDKKGSLYAKCIDD